MKSVGIIAEYNPFHTGHAYHIEESRRKANADGVLVVMSGNFVQRGATAIANKYTRAHSAILGGADLVLELPTIYATQSAEFFSTGAVSTLDKTGIINTLCFGSEEENIEVLKNIADVLYEEPDEYKEVLAAELKKGANLPSARSTALKTILNSDNFDSIISTPNNILALEYLKALKHFNSSINPINILRKGAAYHENSMSKEFTSATALRECFNDEDFNKINGFMPSKVYELYKSHYGLNLPIISDSISELLNYSLLINANNLTDFMDVSNNLAAKLNNYLSCGKILNFSELILYLKSKELTYTRISRALINILLGIKKADLENIKNNNFPSYFRVLAFNEKGKSLLASIKKNSDIPIITNLSDGIDKLGGASKRMIEIDIFAANIYRNFVKKQYGHNLIDEFRQKPVIIDTN